MGIEPRQTNISPPSQPDSLPQSEDSLSLENFGRFARLITQEFGIKMPESKLTMVQSRLMRRVRELRMQSVEQYAQYFFAVGGAEERQQFINAITTNKTDFFREADHFNFLREIVLPATLESGAFRSQARLNVWSAGCSSGQEPYTLAMICADYAAVTGGFDFAILGTDISTRVLEVARHAIYAEVAIEPVPMEFRNRYLLRSRTGAERLVRVVPELRRKVSLHRLNLMDEDYRVRDLFQVIFFRNVMIYFDRITQEAVINRLCRNLTRGGYLFVGHSESLTGLQIPLRQVGVAIYRKTE